MNTDYEAVVSLIELLVKKAGFDLSSNYSETELQKTKDSISSLVRERNTSKDKKELNSLIESLKVRQAKWENNAEMVGKSLVKAYEEGKDYSTVKMRIELLANLAQKGTDNISVGSVYDRIKSLDSEYKTLSEKIENTNYSNEAEKEMDLKYKSYLENKMTSIEIEIEALVKELDSLREVELKDVGIVTKIKEYITKLESDKDKIDKAVKISTNSDVAFEVWERLESAKDSTEEKLNHANDLLNKTEDMLENVKKNRANITERKNMLESDKTRCKTKLNNISKKLEENDYENTSLKMIDVNNSEMMKLELESLNNKKDVVYVDVGKVKEELIKAWSKDRPPIKTRKPVNTSFVDDKKKKVISLEPQTEETIINKTMVLDPVIEEIIDSAKDLKSIEEEVNLSESEVKEVEKILDLDKKEDKQDNIEILDEITANEEEKLNLQTEVKEKPQEMVKENVQQVTSQNKIESVVEDDAKVKEALDNIDELIEKSEKDMKKLTQDVVMQFKDSSLKEEIKDQNKVIDHKKEVMLQPKAGVKEKKNKIELDW